MKKLIVSTFLLLLVAVPFMALRAEDTGTLLQDKVETVKARVDRVISQETKNIPGTDAKSIYQSIEATIIEGPKQNNTVVVNNDYLDLKPGNVFYLTITTRAEDGSVLYAVKDVYRLPSIYFYLALFIFIVVLFGGFQGVRGLISLAGSFALIIYLLLPAILNGYNPIFISVAVASLIIVLGSYVTHGFNKTTSAAVIGMVITVLITGALAYFAVHGTQLSGYNTEEAVYLNFDTGGKINFVGLLLGGILIGLLGVLYDSAISQAIAVEELHNIAPHVSRQFIFKRALRIGREHIGALVNTLAIAYVGASLPLLLLFYTSTAGVGQTVNQEIFSTEIIRTLVGSIGLVLAVPVTTLLSVFILVKPSVGKEEILESEKDKLKNYEHHH